MKKWIIRTVLACVGVVALAAGALLVIGWLNPEPAVNGRTLSEWLVQVRDGSPAKRQEAAEAVRAMGPEALPYLTGELTKGPNTFQRGAQVASKYAPGFLKGPLARFSGTPNDVARKYMAMHAIGLLGTNGAPATPVLGEVLRQSDVGLMSAAATTMIYLGTNSLPELITSLDDGSYDTRSHACYALMALGKDAAPAVPRLGQIIEDERGAIATTAMATLARIGEPAVPVLTNLLSHTNASVRVLAAVGLANMSSRPPSAIPALIKASDDPSPGVRAPAVSAVGAYDWVSAESAAVIFRGLEDPNAEVRLAAAQAAKLRPRLVRESQELFRKLLEDEAAGVRVAAALAIAQTGRHGEWAIPALKKMIEEENPDDRRNIRYALEVITDSLKLAPGGAIVPRPLQDSGADPRIEVRDQ